jgi:phosphoribosyl 1,2-cyclic phosphate phosphodiesterase
MNITFLGTGPNSGIFNKTGRSKRTRSSLLLQSKNQNILIDVSPDFLLQIKKNKINKIDAVLITHPHQDAYGGLKQLNDWLKFPIPLFCQRQTRQIIRSRFKNLPKLKFNPLTPYKTFKVKNLPILPLPVKHSIINEQKFPTLAYKLLNLIYCSDVKVIPKKSQKYFPKITYLILDAAMYFNRQIFSHLNTSDALHLTNTLKVQNLYLTQIGHSYPPYQIAVKEIKQYCRLKRIKTKVTLAYDGLKISAKS